MKKERIVFMGVKEPNRYNLNLSEDVSKWLEQQKKSTGKSYSQLINECVLHFANQDFKAIYDQLKETHSLASRLTNYVIATQDEVLINQEILNYLLNEERHTGDFNTNGIVHLISKEARAKVKDKRQKEREVKLKAKKFNTTDE